MNTTALNQALNKILSGLSPRLKRALEREGVSIEPDAKITHPGQLVGLPEPKTLKPHEKFGLSMQFAKRAMNDPEATPEEREAARIEYEALRMAVGYQRVSEAPEEAETYRDTGNNGDEQRAA